MATENFDFKSAQDIPPGLLYGVLCCLDGLEVDNTRHPSRFAEVRAALAQRPLSASPAPPEGLDKEPRDPYAPQD
jgi:hypothetical protein